MKKILIMLSLLLTTGQLAAEEEQTLTNMVALPTNQTVITEEGSFESAAGGSYSIRLYDTDPGNPGAIIYRSGIIMPRTGELEKVQVTDVTGDDEMEIIVLLRSPDVGYPQSADVFSFVNSELKLLDSVENLSADVEPLEQIRQNY